jgi:hypothetical protein
MTANPNDTARELSAEEARRLLVERIRADRDFAEQLIADPATALAGVDLAALFGAPGDEADEVQGFLWPVTCLIGPVSQCL